MRVPEKGETDGDRPRSRREGGTGRVRGVTLLDVTED